ncbi:S8 family serine peptidase [Paractinoplanes hotanensis]|uniref:S8 family serine peptidase n=1 Tax=Paractinoplanes hotanensis TaxID=2906497 RepID=A0ABT0YDW6_9ACTN|nr:S8 family serine peptidase [Actinoplanes hotanensis]MCM4084250.1 S8 family serine peptidase [Actinoplanes hotanensis]
MTTKASAWSGVLGCLALVAVLTPTGDWGWKRVASVSVRAPSTPPSAAPAPLGPKASVPVQPAAVTGAERVKFYTVGEATPGRPESLSAIAGRLLGAPGRATEILHLNAGRRQADGGAMTDSTTLRAGWTLVLPWDAVGDGVRHGVLTDGPRTAARSPQGATTPASPPGGPAPASPPGRVAPVPAPSPALAAEAPRASAPPLPAAGLSPGAGPGKDGDPARPHSCDPSASSQPRTGSRWAYDRMAADQAWGRAQGEGVLVAVVDSGVNAAAPELAGRVAIGADILTGSGRGDTDCSGSGTAMAGIVAAAPARPVMDGGSPVIGLAPAATILPLRVVSRIPRAAEPGDAATAIEVAVSAGARVVAVGAYVDLTAPAVSDAVRSAFSHDVVVVAPAPAASAGGGSDPPTSELDGLLMVGGVGPDGQPAADYRPDTVDVLAPGIDVASLGPEGAGVRANSGSQYAAAFATGAAALVRSAYPNLDAAQVVHRIKATAERAGQDGPDPVVGWGMINPNAAVSMVLAAETVTPASGGGAGSPLRALTVGLVMVTGLAAVTILARRSPAGSVEAATGESAGRPAVRRAGEEPDDAGAASAVHPVAAEPVIGPVGAPVSGAEESAPVASSVLEAPERAAGAVAEAPPETGGPAAPVRR